MGNIDRRDVLGLIGAGAALGMSMPLGAATRDEVLLLAYFTGKDEGRDGLRFAMSDDGHVFTALRGGSGFLTPTVGRDRLMRDPSITRGPDGTYHLVWTSDWFGSVIGHAQSRDLLRWSPQQEIPVMAAFPGTRNTWAPETIYDPVRRHFVIFWSSSVAGRFGATAEARFDGLNHRPYCTTTKDFRTFTPTRLLFDPMFNSIDFTFLRLDDGRLRLIFKDETNGAVVKRNLRTAIAWTPLGPFGPVSEAFTASMTEGPTAIRLGDAYIVYYDIYEEHRFGAKTTRDFVNWTDVTPAIRFPDDARHGTVLRASRALARRLAFKG